MIKRIAVFAALVLGYVATGMALSASQPVDLPVAEIARMDAQD